ncbi:MAG: 16S rRNA (cytosine(1402)-N(4))-methyltransferase RsmH [Candidatus Kuenenbacteria bacterium]
MLSLHKPVLLREVIEYLDPKHGQNFIDCTYGGGGHTNAILGKTEPDGKMLAIDANPNTQITNYKSRVILVNDNFRNLKKIYEQFFPCAVSGILCDLGLSSIELDEEPRGFSFKRDEPLDMRFNPEANELTAAEILNKFSQEKLIRTFKDFGEVPRAFAMNVSERIVRSRRKKKFETTFDLVDIILDGRSAKGGRNRAGRGIHPATLFFQALRIAVNHELDALIEFLPQAVEILKPCGKLVIISFHSLEDRIVKHYFKEISKNDEAQVKLLTKKPVMASQQEVKDNPRARSGKMRVVEKL